MTASVRRLKRGGECPLASSLNQPLAGAAEGTRDVISSYVTKQLQQLIILADYMTHVYNVMAVFCLRLSFSMPCQYVQQAYVFYARFLLELKNIV